MNVVISHGCPAISKTDFEAYLKTCPDYTRTAYDNAEVYYFRHNDNPFASVIDGKIYFSPERALE